MQYKRRIEDTAMREREPVPCDHCGHYGALDSEGCCSDCSSEIGREMKMAKFEEYLNDKDLEIPEYIRLMVRRCWQKAVTDRKSQNTEVH